METISKIEEILPVWLYRALTLIGGISVLKIFAFSKILHISSMKTDPKFITEKVDTLIRDYSERGLKDVDINSKIVALQLT